MGRSNLLTLLQVITLPVLLVESIRRHPTDDTNFPILKEIYKLDKRVRVDERKLNADDQLLRTTSQGQRSMEEKNPVDHLITGLPLLREGMLRTKHYAGHISASQDEDKKIFYWLFEPDLSNLSKEVEESDIPLVIWLNGGPGCSSMDGLFIENGPFRIVEPGTTFNGNEGSDQWRMELNPHSWHRAPAYMVYIDQPVGTGLSFTKGGNYCTNDVEVNTDFYHFLTQFLLLHAELFLTSEEVTGKSGHTELKLRMRRPLFFSGESHAGHYIPSMIDFILQRNDEIINDFDGNNGIYIPVGGAAIGNGWTDPYNQYAAADAAYGMGLIDLAQKLQLDEREKNCQSMIDEGHFTSSQCFALLDDVIKQSDGGRDAQFKVSQYDTRAWEKRFKKRSFPPGHKVIEAYLGSVADAKGKQTVSPQWNVDSEMVLEALHATESIDVGQYFQECTDPPYNALLHQDGKGVVNELVRVLNYSSSPLGPVRVLFFNGVTDLVCNHVGNEKFLGKLPWDKADEWRTAERFAWRGNGIRQGHPVGYMKAYENLLFLKILDAGHMVPLDQPEVALEMMVSFLYGKSMMDGKQNLDMSDLEKIEKPCNEAIEDAEDLRNVRRNAKGDSSKGHYL